ncbi:hypothetical protein [Nocardia transvalensis]|uniref:hypothetical protein n=1 Tax=Nocardia transvalensis TaxID=37333 RepID=UPI0018930C86|nr:hypothetical protein [Nocardia transvalensis]MBF6330876.1 hypothetical protein [Nocardia transvalensis]
MSDGQMGFNIEIDEKTQGWLDWVSPPRRAAQAQKFLQRAGLRDLPAEPWPEGAPELARLDTLVAELFPDMSTAMAPENADIADAFICFIGECFIKFAGAEWINYEWFGRDHSFYDHVNPALRFDTEDEDIETAWGLMDSMIEYHPEDYDGMFSKMAAIIREYASYHEEKRQG